MKKLKILLMNPWLEYFLGSEIHLYNIAKELERRGHKVSVFSYLKGPMWKVMKKSGIEMVDNPEDEYDITIFNGNPCSVMAPKSSYKIMISNGVIPPEEYPVPNNVDKVVAVSEEINKTLKNKGYNSVIIRNGVDINRYTPKKRIRKKMKNVLLISNKQSPESMIFKMIGDVCQERNLSLSTLGLKFGTSQWSVEEFINQADLVISLGRGVLEAMSCERNVLVCDYQGIDGMVNNKSYYELRKNNFSGRRYKTPINKDKIRKEFDKYNQKQGEKNRNLIIRKHNIQDTVQNILDLYKYRKLNI